MKKLYIVLAAVAVIGIGAVGFSVGSGGGAAVTAPVPVEGLDDPERLVELAQGVTKGDESATVSIIEFGDFQCPACQGFAMQVKPQVELAYVESGRVKFVYYDWPIVSGHPNAFLAARASRCAADQGMYWEYHDNLFRNQARWAPLTNPVSTFVEYAETLGLDRGEFASCVNSDRHAELVTANMELGNQLGVNQTPTIYVEQGGSARRVGPDFQTLSQYIESILSEETGGQ
ncbi:MAG TPA: thioredoxin domain-containing protein [Longimicrobiales bacterium]|nr:thioredoxin domain-containing protein [Longimicrobiales bacterium]